MDPTNSFKMTYYIAAGLAWGGVLTIKDDSLVFFPGTIERAMGAKDEVIPFEKIKMVEITGTITESLMVRTIEKAHRFVGTDLYKIRDRIDLLLQNYQPTSAVSPGPGTISGENVTAVATQVQVSPQSQVSIKAPAQKVSSASQCPSCSAPIRSEFHFCPQCKAVLIASCPTCHRSVTSGWKFCAFCGNNLP